MPDENIPDSEWEPNDEVCVLTLFLLYRDGSPRPRPFRVIVDSEHAPAIIEHVNAFNNSEMFAVGSWNLKTYAPKPF